MIQDLRFTSQWNNKLICQCFSTFRLWDENKYKIGSRFNIWINDHKCTDPAELVDATPIMLKDVTPAMAMLDTGHPLEYFQSIMQRMYKTRYEFEGDKIKLGYYIFKFCHKDT